MCIIFSAFPSQVSPAVRSRRAGNVCSGVQAHVCLQLNPPVELLFTEAASIGVIILILPQIQTILPLGRSRTISTFCIFTCSQTTALSVKCRLVAYSWTNEVTSPKGLQWMCCQNLLYRLGRISDEVVMEIQSCAEKWIENDALGGWDEHLCVVIKIQRCRR